jgi:hypothetical protein
MRSVQHNTASRLLAHRDAHGTRLAIADEERRLDYRALEGRVARCAALLADAGVARGDRVALVLGNRSAYLETVLAAARLAAIATPLNARLTAPGGRPAGERHPARAGARGRRQRPHPGGPAGAGRPLVDRLRRSAMSTSAALRRPRRARSPGDPMI